MSEEQHRFVGLRQWGMNPSDDKPCQKCGVLKGSHNNTIPCRARVVMNEEQIMCDQGWPHLPLFHKNAEHGLVWTGHSPASEVRGLFERETVP